jgi:hypothetical protein
VTHALLAAAAVTAIACGPSQRDVALAKMSRYNGDKLVLFNRARQAVEKKHRILHSDETTLTIITRGRWYTPDGLASQWSDPNDVIDDPDAQRGTRQDPFGSRARPAIPDKSFYLQLTVRMLPEATNWIVYVDSKVARFNVGMPILEPIDTTRIDLPGWVNGKRDRLAYDIYESLKGYSVRGLSGSSPVQPMPPPDPEPENPAEPHPVDMPFPSAPKPQDDGAGPSASP